MAIPQTTIQTEQKLLRIKERLEVGVKVQKLPNGVTRYLPVSKLVVSYALLDTSDGPAVRCAAGSDAVVISAVYYNTVTHKQEVLINGKFSPVAEWLS